MNQIDVDYVVAKSSRMGVKVSRQYVKNSFFLICTLIFILSIQAKAADALSQTTLPLECLLIPALKEQLCTLRTDSPYGPYDDVVFYRKTAQDEIFLLGSSQGGVGSFAGIGFSAQGRYMWISWAEEGHPSFSFYETRAFLGNGLSTPSLATLGDYDFDAFVDFNDEGTISYTRGENTTDACAQQPCVFTLDLKQ